MEKDNKKIELEFKTIDDIPGVSLIKLSGYVDSYNSKYFQDTIMKYIKEGHRNILMDCVGLSYLSSAGIGSFVALSEELKDNGTMVLFGLNPKVMEVFTLLGFDKFFTICSNLNEAINSIKDLMHKGEKSILADLEENIVFPFVFECKVCGKKLKASKPGVFNCPLCKTKITIDKDGNTSFE